MREAAVPLEFEGALPHALLATQRQFLPRVAPPFLVAEVFTGKAGQITPLEDTIRSFEEICDGKWDHLPEDAFMYVGSIEQAEEQAKKMAGG